MKNILYLFIIATLFIFASCENDDNDSPDNQFSSQTVAMGSNSINDVYYSFKTGVVSSRNRAEWDIAFSVPLQTATILINEGAGVELYCVGDTNDWALINENTINGLLPRYNDESDWNKGAFNVNAKGFPNYGWGTYHASNPDHNVGGDSIYVMKLTNGTLIKFMVRAKIGETSSNVLRWDNLQGTEEVVKSFTTSTYKDKKHFIHYSVVDQKVVEAEPDMSDWDLLFTRYLTKVSMGPVSMEYPVTGIISNPDAKTAKVTGDPEKVNAPSEDAYNTAPDVIGYDWKTVNQQTMVTSIVDSASYFVKSTDGKTYQLYFTEYDGLSSGNINFKTKAVE